MRFAKWFVNTKHKYKSTEVSLNGISEQATALLSHYKRKVLIKKVEQKVAERKWPVGGLLQLQKAVESVAGNDAVNCTDMSLAANRILLAASFYTGNE
jgi:hypothetical protein